MIYCYKYNIINIEQNIWNYRENNKPRWMSILEETMYL